jgi:hypothetical protein
LLIITLSIIFSIGTKLFAPGIQTVGRDAQTFGNIINGIAAFGDLLDGFDLEFFGLSFGDSMRFCTGANSR